MCVKKPASAFDATTTHKSDFTEKKTPIRQPIRPSSASYLRPDQPFSALSTHQADFDKKIVGHFSFFPT
jgi:hypothetical protein